jgi:sugar-specific transcriptional regulator TrmB
MSTTGQLSAERLFLELGFSPAEGKTFLALAELGKASASSIAKAATLPRSTAYSALSVLVSRGVVSVDQSDSGALYIANPPSTFNLSIQAEYEELLNKKAQAQAAAAQLAELISPVFESKKFHVPRVQFFEGKKNVEGMLYSQQKEWKQSISKFDFTWWGYQDVEFVRDYKVWLDQYWDELDDKERINLFSNESEIERDLKGRINRREIRQLPTGTEFSSTIWVVGDYVVMLMTRQKPHYAIQIKDPILAANQRTVFQLLWNSKISKSVPKN